MNAATQQFYSHGLEKIYDFEVLNPATVRKIEPFVRPPSLPISTPSLSSHKSSPEPYLHLGPEVEEALIPFQLEESLECLNLSPFAFKALSIKGYKRVAEVARDLHALTGLGPSHVDEIRNKLHALTGPFPMAKKETVDLISLVRNLFSHIDAKERYVALEHFSLGSLFPLKPNELHEISRWSQEMKATALQKAFATCNKTAVEEKLRAIISAFIKPWLRRRIGVAKQFELDERLFMALENTTGIDISRVVQLILKITAQETIYDTTLVKVGSRIYAYDHFVGQEYREVAQLAKGYFYNTSVGYPLHKLSAFVEQELIKRWEMKPAGFVEKILRIAPEFILTRNAEGILFIYLNSEV